MQGSKVLVVADSKSFFTLYSAIQAAGLRTCQLDRLLQAKAGAQTANTAEVLQAALKDTSCLLVRSNCYKRLAYVVGTPCNCWSVKLTLEIQS